MAICPVRCFSAGFLKRSISARLVGGQIGTRRHVQGRGDLLVHQVLSSNRSKAGSAMASDTVS